MAIDGSRTGRSRTDLADVERRLWQAADQLRANSALTPAQYRDPILGLIFLAYAEHRFKELRPQLEAKASPRRPVTPDDFRAEGVLYVPDVALLDYLVHLPEAVDIGKAVDTAMSVIETANTGLNDVLPRGYAKLNPGVLQQMLRLFAPLPGMLSGDAFGLIYEYFLSNFALAEGRLGGEFFTPQSIVRLIVEVIEPFHGRVFDPACGSGGMFVQCAKFVDRHSGSPNRDLSVFPRLHSRATSAPSLPAADHDSIAWNRVSTPITSSSVRPAHRRSVPEISSRMRASSGEGGIWSSAPPWENCSITANPPSLESISSSILPMRSDISVNASADRTTDRRGGALCIRSYKVAISITDEIIVHFYVACVVIGAPPGGPFPGERHSARRRI